MKTLQASRAAAFHLYGNTTVASGNEIIQLGLAAFFAFNPVWQSPGVKFLTERPAIFRRFLNLVSLNVEHRIDN